MDRIHLLVSRQLNKALASSARMRELKLTPTKCLAYLIIMKSIEIITDHTLRIAKPMTRTKKVNSIFRETAVIKRIYDTYTTLKRITFTWDCKAANEIIDREEGIKTNLAKLTGLLTDTRASYSKHFQEIVYHLYSINNHMMKIAEAVLDMSVTPENNRL